MKRKFCSIQVNSKLNCENLKKDTFYKIAYSSYGQAYSGGYTIIYGVPYIHRRYSVYFSGAYPCLEHILSGGFTITPLEMALIFFKFINSKCCYTQYS